MALLFLVQQHRYLGPVFALGAVEEQLMEVGRVVGQKKLLPVAPWVHREFQSRVLLVEDQTEERIVVRIEETAYHLHCGNIHSYKNTPFKLLFIHIM
jgi:hypothetical protein